MMIEEYIKQLVELNIKRAKLAYSLQSEEKFREELIKNYPPVNPKWFNDNDIVELSKEEVAYLVIGIDPTRQNSWEKEKAYMKNYPKKDPKPIADEYRKSLPWKSRQELIKIDVEIQNLTKWYTANLQNITKQLNAAFPGDGLISRNAFLDFLRNYKKKYPDSLSHIPNWVFKDEPKKPDYALKTNTEHQNKDEYIKSCLELLFSHLRENEKPDKPQLIKAFAYASNIKIVKGNYMFNQNGRKLRGFSYSTIEKVIKQNFSYKVGDKRQEELSKELMTIANHNKFDSFKTAEY